MELSEAAYKSCQRRLGVLLPVVDALLKQLDDIAEAPGFVEELATVTALTKALSDIKKGHGNSAEAWRHTIAQMHKAAQGAQSGNSEAERQWAVAEAKVAAASKEAAAALAAMQALWQKAEGAAKAGNAKALASIKAQAKAFKAPLEPAAIAEVRQLMAKAVLLVNKSAIDKDALAVYVEDGRKLTDKLKTAGVSTAEIVRLQGEIAKLAIPAGVFAAAFAKVMKIGPQDAASLAKVAQGTPNFLLVEIEKMILRNKLKLVAKDIQEQLRRLGLI